MAEDQPKGHYAGFFAEMWARPAFLSARVALSIGPLSPRPAVAIKRFGAQPAMLALALSVAGLACRGQQPPPCVDGPCRLEAVRELWGQPPEQVAVAITSLPDERQRLLALEAYFLHHGEHVSQDGFCAGLPKGATRQRCLDLTGRPHLWDESRQDPAPSPATTIAQGGAGLEGCTRDATPVGCAIEQSRALAADGVSPVDKPCAALDEPRWADECRLQAAAELVLRHGVGGTARAVAVCQRATVLRSMCMGHTGSRLAELAPSAANPDDPGWQSLLATPAALRAAFGDPSPQVELWVDHFWSMATWFSMRQGDRLNPEVLAALPPEALPHMRSAVAWRLIEATGPGGAGLEPLGRRLVSSMAGAVIHPDPDAAPRRALGLRRMQDYWQVPADPGLPSAHFQGLSRRLLAVEERADGAICLLEAAAQLRPSWTELFSQGSQHPDPAVSATAQRLQAALETTPATPSQP